MEQEINIQVAAERYWEDKKLPLEETDLYTQVDWDSEAAQEVVKQWCISDYSAGYNNCKLQEESAIIRFAEWIRENGWASCDPIWVNGEHSSDSDDGRSTYTEKTTQELYRQWKKNIK